MNANIGDVLLFSLFNRPRELALVEVYAIISKNVIVCAFIAKMQGTIPASHMNVHAGPEELYPISSLFNFQLSYKALQRAIKGIFNYEFKRSSKS
jgi:hypothetical protein